MNRPIIPCLWFDSQAEEAAKFYSQAFPDGRVIAVSHYPENFDNPGGKPRGSVLTVEFEIAGQRFTALNGGPHFTVNPSVSFFVFTETAKDSEKLFAALERGGNVLMPLSKYPWSERYGWVQDRFGVSWQVMVGGETGIAPCLMFAGARRGLAEEALRRYAEIFPGGRIEMLERYRPGEGPEGKVKHGRVVLGGQTLLAMDSHVEHDITFNEAVSLQVLCDNQAEVDRYWAALSQGGQEGPCGWLKDRFGLSWQVVPRTMVERMTSKDVAARERAFQAMLGMTKLDLAALDAAFAGRARPS